MAAKLTNELIVVTAMVAAQVLHCTLDELEGTPYYKRKLKVATKVFQKELTKECDDTIAAMYAADEKSMVHLEEDISIIAGALATMDPKKILQITDFIKTIE
jgi:hypothetical protein